MNKFKLEPFLTKPAFGGSNGSVLTKKALGVAFAVSAGLAVVGPAGAVTVDIDVQSEGEPVPGTTISFETPDGKEVPATEVTELVEEDKPAETPQQDQPPAQTPPAESETTAAETPAKQPPAKTEPETEPEPEVAEVPYTPFRADLPDTFIGQDIIVVVRKGDELIKREPVRVDPEKPKVDIEAYDPADANLVVETKQPKTCRRGRDCAQHLSVTNTGNGIYTGPVFLTGMLHGTPRSAGEEENQWTCGYAGGGRQLCQNDVSLQPGETAKWDVTVRLNGKISQQASSCLSVTGLAGQPEGRRDPLLQAVQLGLAKRGINTGRPDGIMGPKTEAAIGRHLEQSELEETSTLPQIFQSLYGISPARLARLGTPEDESCTKLSLLKEKPRVARKKKKKRKKKRRARREVVEEEYYEEDEPRIRIGIGIGFGGTINRGHRRHRKHVRPRHRQRQHRIERRRQPRIERRRHRRIERRWQD